jgi:hypothetical protein
MAVLASVGSVTAEAQQAPNLLISRDFADPSVLKTGDGYYAFSADNAAGQISSAARSATAPKAPTRQWATRRWSANPVATSTRRASTTPAVTDSCCTKPMALCYSAADFRSPDYHTSYATASNISGPYEKSDPPLPASNGNSPGGADVVGEHIFFHGWLDGSLQTRGLYELPLEFNPS